jgi:MFS transporter, DHA1 family, multidrug resistance protein
MAAYTVSTSWRWPLWEIVIMAGFLLVLLVFLPESSAPTILYKRAVRLRALTGKNYRTKRELVKLKPSAVLADAMIKPTEIAVLDPAIGFVALYTALVYGIYYSFFEAFPIVFPRDYGFGLGGTSLVFLSIVIGATFGMVATVLYYYFWFIPRGNARNWKLEPEEYLRISLVPVVLIPPSLFLFAWTARESVHWIAPAIGVVLFAMTSFVLFQGVVSYIPQTYPDYTASLFASNDLVRSSLAVGSIHWSTPMYENLGIGRGVSLVAGLSVMGVIGLFFLYINGKKLRARSKFAVG